MEQNAQCSFYLSTKGTTLKSFRKKSRRKRKKKRKVTVGIIGEFKLTKNMSAIKITQIIKD